MVTLRSPVSEVHVTSNVVEDVPAMVRWLKSLGVKAGLTLNPDVEIEKILPYVEILDNVLVMSVFAGFGGQEFIPESLERIRKLRDCANKENPDLDIEVDGGVYPSNAKEIIEAGANVLVAGTAVFGSDDMQKTIQELRGQ